jgi:hypothetical protein
MLQQRAVSVTTMKKTRIGTTLALLIGIALAPTLACAGVSGTVSAVVGDRITVSGAVYTLEEDTSFEDVAGNPISLPEIRPGTPVDLEFDEEGRLAVIRATVVR